RDHSALGNDVEHSDLLRHSLGMIVKRQNVAENHQLRLFCAPRQTGRHNVRRRHATVGSLMVFVDADPVETELISQLQLIQITVVKRMAQLGIIELVGTNHPRALVRLRKILRQIGPWHQMKAINLHNSPSQTYLKFSVEYWLAESEKR